MITIPHFSWLKRLSITLATALFVVGSLLVTGWLLEIDSVVYFTPEYAPVQPSAALTFAVFGVSLLVYELGYRRAPLLALFPGLLGLSVLARASLPYDLGVDELLLRDYLSGGHAEGALSLICALCFVLAGFTFPLLTTSRLTLRTTGIAFAGSILMSVGIATVLGYLLSLPVVYRWGTNQSLPPGTAILLLVLGLGLLSTAWREHQGDSPGSPVWIPMPVMVASGTLTAILWMGLRDAEALHLGTNTQIALRDFATAIGREIERQTDAIERISQRRSQGELGGVDWSAETKTLRREIIGNQAVYRLDAQFRTTAVEPQQGNEALTAFDHSSDPVRRAALEQSRERGRAVISGTLRHIGVADGFAIYAPIQWENQMGEYIGADVSYARFFGMLERSLKLTGKFRAQVLVGSDLVFSSSGEGGAADIHKLEEVFNIADRRVRLELSPSLENVRLNRRYLPELALGAGCGITLLLGLSVHLARTARTGLRAAKLSNLKLLGENEERRRIEEMLKVSDERLRLALDSTQIGIFEWNLPSNHLYYSPGVWGMLGYPAGTIPSTPEAWTSLIHPNDLPIYRISVERQLKGEVAFIEPEYRVRASNGEWRWLYARARTVVQSGSGTPLRIIGTLQDITARKHAEEALRLSQATTRKLSLVASRTDNLVIIASRNGTIEWVNESFERILEYSLAEVVGKNPAAFMIGPETELRSIRRIKSAMRRGEGISIDVVNYSKSGKKYHLHLEIQPVKNEAGVLENFIAIQADISARVETERNLRRAKAEADAASRAKSEFLASMSHEIRTPMNGVIGMTSLLLDTSLNHDQRDCVNTIRSSGEALLTIINDILDFSKIESGRMELERLPFELAVTIEDALDLFALQAAAKKIELVYHLDDSVPSWVEGDVTRLRQVLVNLVNNAVKFTPTGSIAVTVRRIGQASTPEKNTVVLEFAVRDTGIGIPADRLNRLFRPFSQVDSSTTRKYGGTGLGLAICHRLCGLMGGEIKVETNVGSGSTFTFTIEVEAVNTPPGWGLPELPVRLNYGTVLCVEDHPVAQSRLHTFLTLWGARPVGAATPEAAADYLSSETLPVALILDYELIEKSGGRLFREILQQGSIPTLLLLPAGQSSPAVEVFAERRGITMAHKPLRTHALIRSLQTLFDIPSDSQPPFAALPENLLLAQELPLDVLLVEDNPVNQKVAQRFLDRLGYRADAVSNGVEAVHTLLHRHYHLVLMDLQMPEMDGFEAARQIRRRVPADRQPKIIALTANALHGDREQCLAAGMDDYITKPVKLLDIDRAIRRQFSLGSRSPLRTTL